MDTQETELYKLLIITAFVISSILVYSFFAALRQQVRYRQVHNREIGSEINALENERKRIAADLHDDLGPVLSAAKMKLSGISGVDGHNAQLVGKSMEYIENISGRLRSIAAGLLPAVLLDKGLVIALQQYIRNLDISDTLSIKLHAGNLPMLEHEVNIHLYRIMQEIIHNTCKHGNATRLHMEILFYGNKLVLSTADDGTGFNYTEMTRQKKGHGLLNIQNRVQLLDGNLNVQTDKGTCYYIEIPVHDNMNRQGRSLQQLKNTPYANE